MPRKPKKGYFVQGQFVAEGSELDLQLKAELKGTTGATKTDLTLADIATRPFILLDMPQTSTYLLTLFDILAKRPEVRFHTRSYETVRSAVASGFGMSILNMRPIGSATSDGPAIVRRPILDVLPPPSLIILDLYGTAKPLFVRLFIEILRNFFNRIGPSGFSVTLPAKSP